MHNPTPQQTAIFDAVAAGHNIIVEALAGTGKTSTIVETVRRNTGKKMGLLAFNKKIAQELVSRLENIPNVEVKTLNAMGFAAWRAGRSCTLDTQKQTKLLEDILKEKNLSLSYDEKRQVISIVDAARLHGLVPANHPKGGVGLMPDTQENWLYLCAWTSLDIKSPEDQIIFAKALLTYSISKGFAGYIDFTDQVYLPVIFGANWPKYHILFVDEAQDLSPLNHKMARMIQAEQKIFVGDKNQSIYAFRGAMTDSMDLLEKAMANKAQTVHLPLSVTFRCGHAIVARQQSYVPEYMAHTTNPPGEVIHWPTKEMWNEKDDDDMRWTVDHIPDSAAILCRNNAPLITMALHILAKHRPVQILGRDFAETLKRDIKKATGKDNLPIDQAILACRQYYNSQLKRNPTNAQLQAVEDKTFCIQALAGSKAKTRDDLLTILDAIFSDEAKPNAITLATGHKSKGLEWPWVMHLNPELIPSKYALKSGDPEELRQEYNLRYVLETRPSHTLVLASLADLSLEQ